jgi:outer membrane receptor protein involved in Fe transport
MSFGGGRWTGTVLSLAVVCLLRAQPPTGAITIQVQDPSGAALQASGRVRGPVERGFRTDSRGFFRFDQLPFGRYQVDISRSGFASQSVTIDLASATTVAQTITMAIGSQSAAVNVIATTPLAGTDLSPDQIAAPVQTADATDLANSGALDLSDFMNRRLNGVAINEVQGNPFQPDVNFRGYTASPLLGTPEGLSVYLDGVRQNQPFGDVVSWDLIPKDAISEMTLLPGSDPLFGLNTLGGALSVTTKNGIDNAGVEGTLTYGSSGRKAVDASYGGGRATGFNWFLAGSGFHESGWRFDSPSDVRQGFVRLGWRTAKTDLAFTTTYAYNTLIGNGLQDYRLLAADYSSVYTIADSTANRSPSFNFIARHTFTDSLTFSGNAWFRNIRTEQINPNFNGDVFGNSIYQPNSAERAALTAAGYTGFPTSGATAANTPFPKWRCIANALLQNNPDAYCDAITIYSKEAQNEYGVSGQITWLTSPSFGRNQFTSGAALDRSGIDYTQNTAYGYVNPGRTITNVAAWQDGSTNNPVDSRVGLHGQTPNGSLYFTDTLTVLKTVNVTLSGRYNRFEIDNSDRINPVAGPGSLDGDYVYQRFNPSIGVTWSPVPTLNTYARYSQGSRAPTAIELGCADPANPCSLPNALAGDPPLKQVVTDTWEVGLRGRPELPRVSHLSWNAGAFRAENSNDILFVSSTELGSGYFRNFAKTRREGFDADLGGRMGRAVWGLDYTFLEATYQSPAILDGSANNTSDSALSGYPGLDGNIYVHPGNRIPLIPKSSGKAWVDYQATKKFAFNLNEVMASSSYVRGNENNAYKADGVYYLGPGVLPGYAVTDLQAHYDLTKKLRLGLQIDNLFDHHYYTAGQLANTGFSAQGGVLTRPFPAWATGPEAGSYPAQSAAFFTPGAPRRVWVELLLRF